jgi:hypothetical protein
VIGTPLSLFQLKTLAVTLCDHSNGFLGFAIYGRQGLLLTDPAGPPVDDDMASAENLQESYYYSFPGN